jgi:hypothetical protein
VTKIPGFEAEKALFWKGETYGEIASAVGVDAGHVLSPASLPQECLTTPGHSQPWTDTWCNIFAGPIQWCQDKCRVPNPNNPAQGRVIAGSWYPCGVCIGFDF